MTGAGAIEGAVRKVVGIAAGVPVVTEVEIAAVIGVPAVTGVRKGRPRLISIS